MRKSDDYFKRLIFDYFSGNLTKEGERELLAWLELPEHKQLFKKHIREYYAISCSATWVSIDVSKAKDTVFRRLNVRRELSRWLSYAACLVLALTASFLGYKYLNHDPAYEQYTDYTATTALLHGHRAILSVGDDRQVVLGGSKKTLLSTGRSVAVILKDSNSIEYTGINELPDDSVRLHTLEVPPGSEFNITLSDGTRVWMNAASELTYPERFVEGRREVILSGEAYFEVTPNLQAPFIVKTRDMDLRVLGTSFNVKAYQEDAYCVTTLVTGKIQQNYSNGERVFLSPHKQAVYDRKDKHLRVCQVDVNEALAWKNGRFILKDMPLEDIFKELSRWYDFKVNYLNENLKKIRFYVNIDRYDDVQKLLEKLQRTNGIRFLIDGKNIMVYGVPRLK